MGDLDKIADKASRIAKVAAALGERFPDIAELDAIVVLALGIRGEAVGAVGRLKARG